MELFFFKDFLKVAAMGIVMIEVYMCNKNQSFLKVSFQLWIIPMWFI